jgi:hypothetical protein
VASGGGAVWDGALGAGGSECGMGSVVVAAVVSSGEGQWGVAAVIVFGVVAFVVSLVGALWWYGWHALSGGFTQPLARTQP